MCNALPDTEERQEKDRALKWLVTILCIYQQFEADMNEQEYLEDDPDWKTFQRIHSPVRILYYDIA